MIALQYISLCSIGHTVEPCKVTKQHVSIRKVNYEMVFGMHTSKRLYLVAFLNEFQTLMHTLTHNLEI